MSNLKQQKDWADFVKTYLYPDRPILKGTHYNYNFHNVAEGSQKWLSEYN